MKNKKVIIIGVIATLAMIGLGAGILISGNAKDKEIQTIEATTEAESVVEVEVVSTEQSEEDITEQLGEDTSEADKAKEVKETVKEEQKTAQESKDVYEGSSSTTTTTQNTTPAVAAPADTNDINAQAQEQAASSSGDSSLAGIKTGDTLGDGSIVTGAGTDEELQQQFDATGRTW